MHAGKIGLANIKLTNTRDLAPGEILAARILAGSDK